jgi:carboxyl-terminal processing protease
VLCLQPPTRLRAVPGGLPAVLVVVLSLALAACSAKAPASGESRPAAPEVKASPAAQAAPGQTLDPREASLSAAIVLLLEHEHLLRKPIDDELSRTAFDTYLDRLDASKMFLLRRDRESLGRYADKIDDELRSGSLELAHEGEKLYVARVEAVEKIVAELLAAPFNHDDEEYFELDPKKVEVATTDAELRDRWRRRLELEVLEKVGQMEARLAAQQELHSADATKPGKGKAADHKVGKAPGKAGATSGKPGDGKIKSADARGSHGGPSGAGAAGKGARASTETDRTPPGVDGPTGPDSSDQRSADDEDDPRTPLADIPATPEAREAKARADLAKTYAARFTRLRHPGPFDAPSELVNAVASSLDPHTTYLPPADKANFDIRMSGSLEGIGAVLRERDDYVEVVEIVPGGASWRHGGIAAGDTILSVANEGQEPVDVVDMRLDDVVKMIRGPKGTSVTLRIKKPTGVQDTVTITRDVIVVEEAYARGATLTRKGGKLYGYIHLPSFYGGRGPGQRTSGRDVSHLLAEMKQLKVAGVVLDIRGNGGGLLGEAVTMTGSMIDRGPVVQVQNSRGQRETYTDDQSGTDYDGPIVVLVDKFSASASEILAGALQDYHRAIIVGTGPTHGKGTVQTLADLDRVVRSNVDLGTLKITVQQFFRVSGSSTQREGVTPDILLPDPAGHLDTREGSLEHAIPWSQIPAVDHDTWPAAWKTPALVERSAARVAKQPLLAKVAALTQVLKAARDDTKVPLAKAAWEAHRKQQRAAFDAASPNLTASPAAFTVKTLDDPNTPPPGGPPGPGGKPVDRLAHWRENVSRDPWIEESVNVLGDMAGK